MIAFRGAPVADPLHARQAVATALAMQAELRLWQQAIRYYRAQNWDQAEAALFNLRRMAPQDELYAVYARRVVALRAHPPGAGWGGVTTFDIK